MINLNEIKKIPAGTDKIQNILTIEKEVTLSILRLDKIDEDISGNKLFKLHYFLNDALSAQKRIITFGGAYSNHLAATAKSCKMLGIPCIGIVRGEKPKDLSHTLLFCLQHGMQLEFISRTDYKNINNPYPGKYFTRYENAVIIPEGGFSLKGAAGASLIYKYCINKDLTHICCPVGTGTTLAGLITSPGSETIIGFSAIKGQDDIDDRIHFLLGNAINKKYSVNQDYHFGGYAKKTGDLISFMNHFYREFSIPTDFVYTGKMMFGVFDSIKKNCFPPGSKILCIHTGGLQGNLSLPAGTLNF